MIKVERRAILATKSGWMFSCKIIKETPKTYTLRDIDSDGVRKVSKADGRYKVFESGTYEGVDEIHSWILE